MSFIESTLKIEEQVNSEMIPELQRVFKKFGCSVFKEDETEIQVVPLKDSWILRISSPKGAELRFGEYEEDGMVIIFPIRMPMSHWSDLPRIERGEWFECIRSVPRDGVVSKLGLRVGDKEISISFSSITVK